MVSFSIGKTKQNQPRKLPILVWMHQVHARMAVNDNICVQLTLYNISLWLSQIKKMFKDQKLSQTEF